MHSDDSDDGSFRSAPDSPQHTTTTSLEQQPPNSEDERFPPEQEKALIAESNTTKTTANTLFSTGHYAEAVQSYDRALAACPGYLDYEVAVLKANVAACHIKLAEWKSAVASATASLERLERLDPAPPPSTSSAEPDAARVHEVDDAAAARIEALHASGRSTDDVRRMRAKALLRRGKARTEVGGWASLQGAVEDYKQLAAMPDLSTLDRRTVDAALRALPPRLEEAKQNEMGEMMGKLKELGNGILKPFGLSTDNFQFTKDENSGGYSMQFNQGKGNDKAK